MRITHATKAGAATTLLGLFMVLYMLVSQTIQERIMLGQVPIALIVGVIFGPEAAGLFNPLGWSNVRNATLEFSRIILAVQCFGNAIELPKCYVERHWKSLAWIIGPVMLCGWFMSTCWVKFMVPSFDWQQALACAACFNAIDPVLAQSVLSGKWSKRVPKHLRDLLRAEAAINGMTTTLVLDLAKYLLQPIASPRSTTIRFFSIALPYEVLFGTVSGILIGYTARRSMRKAHERDTVDRPSLLAYYLSVAMFSLGFGTILGVDEINTCFFAGIGLDNDDWYQEKTEETFFASCIDLLLNLSYFVFIGALVPWSSFNSEVFGIEAWRLVVGTIGIFLFRRIPAIILFKPIIPDIKTWREAMFYGHFGPIGAGALFSALLLHGALQSTGSSADAHDAGSFDPPEYHKQLWTVVMFVFVSSSIVHGTSVALFTLGRHVNALTLTMSYDKAVDSQTWMDRLPRIESRSRSQISATDSDTSIDGLPPLLSGPFLGRMKEDKDAPDGQNYRRSRPLSNPESPEAAHMAPQRNAPYRAYQFGNIIIVEDEEGEVIKKIEIPEANMNRDQASPSRTSSIRDFMKRSRQAKPESTSATKLSESGRHTTELSGPNQVPEALQGMAKENPDDEGTEIDPPGMRAGPSRESRDLSDAVETAAERRRRLAALGEIKDESSDSEDDEQSRQIRPVIPRVSVSTVESACPSANSTKRLSRILESSEEIDLSEDGDQSTEAGLSRDVTSMEYPLSSSRDRSQTRSVRFADDVSIIEGW